MPKYVCISMFVWRAGVLLISLALCADAAIGNVQEKAMKLHNGSNSEMVIMFILVYTEDVRGECRISLSVCGQSQTVSHVLTVTFLRDVTDWSWCCVDRCCIHTPLVLSTY